MNPAICLYINKLFRLVRFFYLGASPQAVEPLAESAVQREPDSDVPAEKEESIVPGPGHQTTLYAVSVGAGTLTGVA